MSITKIALFLLVISFANSLAAEEWAKEFKPGNPLPDVAAIDQWGKEQSTQTLMGTNGLIFFFNRSTVW